MVEGEGGEGEGKGGTQIGYQAVDGNGNQSEFMLHTFVDCI